MAAAALVCCLRPAAFLLPGRAAREAGAVLRHPSAKGTAWDAVALGGTPQPEARGSSGAAWLALASVTVAAAFARHRRRTCLGARGGGDEESAWTGAEKVSTLTGEVPVVMDSVAVAKVLPHRYPFLLVDKVIELEPGKRAVGVKCVTANEPQFTGHFPNKPIMPGVLMVEALAQLFGIVCLQPPMTDGTGNPDFFFTGISGVRFRKPVVPGDTLVMEATLTKFKESAGIAKASGKGYVDGKLAVEVKEMTFVILKEEK